jgi:hypothetical protein
MRFGGLGGETTMAQSDKVIQYYQATQRDYECFWMSADSLAIHFGYYDETVRTHDASLLKMNEVLARCAQITSHDHILGTSNVTVIVKQPFNEPDPFEKGVTAYYTNASTIEEALASHTGVMPELLTD